MTFPIYGNSYNSCSKPPTSKEWFQHLLFSFMILPYISSNFGEMTPVLYTSSMVLVDDRLLGAVPIRNGYIYIYRTLVVGVF